MTGEYNEAHCKAACEHIAREIVRPLVQRYFRSDALLVFTKGDKSVATEADRAIEKAIRAYLGERFPGFGVIGEEFGAQDTHSEYVWTIDPIDGTEAFVAGLPLFGTLLAVIRQTPEGGRLPILGALYLPVQDQLVVGNRIETTLEGRPIKMAATAASTRSILLLGNLSEIAKRATAEQCASLWRIARRYRSTHTWGECHGYLSMLTGNVQARIELGLGIDDIAPLEPILLGAGGAVTGWDGTSLSHALSDLPDLADLSASFGIVAAVDWEAHEALLAALHA